ncbi:MAG TPA: DUF481 domain-containing protein [Blastocatellia bacterium]|nr:DUF481 domain-containing protein [Blastocatellia bacterium]
MKIVSIRAFVLAFLLLSAAPIRAGEKTDVLVMKNADRLTCELVGLNSGVLYVKLDYVDGTISVQWSQVVRLETNRLLIVKTQSGAAYTGKITTAEAQSGQPVKIEVAQTPEKKVVLDRSQIVAMDPTSESFWQRFNGDITTGLLYSKGNESTQYNVSSSVEYPRERWAAHASFNANLSSSSGDSTSTRNQLGFGIRRLLHWNNYFYAGLADFLQSSEQGIGLQTTLGGGIGRYFKNTNRARISLLGGFAWQRTNYKDSNPAFERQNIAAALISAEVKFFKFKKTNLDVTASLFPAISEPGRVYFRTNESYYVKLFNNLSWNISFYGSWDNRPPNGLSGSDYGSSSGLSWTFGNK